MKNSWFSLTLIVMFGAACSNGTSSQDAEKLRVANAMVTAWNTMNWNEVYELFAEDGVLHSVMMDPVVGREAIRKRMSYIEEGTEQIELRIINMGVVGEVVFLERVDEFVFNGNQGAVPVVGVMEIEGGKITEWREYYDHKTLSSALSPE